MVRYRVLARGAGAGATQAKQDHAALRDYFTLDIQLAEISRPWAADKRYRDVSPYLSGTQRVLVTISGT